MPIQQVLTADYIQLPPEELTRRIAERKGQLGDDLVILGHHYQADEVIQFADFVGDSLKLSQLAAEQERAKYIVFCGVHFMAESADILSSDDQTVCLPNFRAGCAMAEMAEPGAVEAGLQELSVLSGDGIVPVAYVNSTAAVKGITGRAGGACCTSSNVRNVFDWALRPVDQGGAGGKKIYALPDEHLARNTAVAMGYSEDDCAVYDPSLPNGGLTAGDVDAATFLLWKGHCYVHQLFDADRLRQVRRDDPDATIIVHPECSREIVALADQAGSTEQIRKAVTAAPAGSTWYVGTEVHMVQRLAANNPDKTVRPLGTGSGRPAMCVQMAMIDLPHLLWVLDGLADGTAVNRVTVPPDLAADARLALQRMIDIKAVDAPSRSA